MTNEQTHIMLLAIERIHAKAFNYMCNNIEEHNKKPEKISMAVFLAPMNNFKKEIAKYIRCVDDPAKYRLHERKPTEESNVYK